MKITTVTICKHESASPPRGRAYQADGQVVVINDKGLHYIAEAELSAVQLQQLAPKPAHSIYYPEVCPRGDHER